MRKFVPELEGWRGCAILILMVGHFGPNYLFPMGRLGVEFFFVLSGRLMAQLLFEERMPLKDFYIRRASRVLPALWVFGLLVAFGTYFVGKFNVSLSTLLRALTFTINYTQPNSAMSHVWSLCVEEHSYLLLSCIALLCRALPTTNASIILLALSATCIVNGAAQTWYAHRGYYDVYWHTDVRASSILIAAAMFLERRRLELSPAQTLVSIAIGVALNVIPWVPDPIKYSMGTALLALGVVNAEKINVLQGRLLALAGLWSFSIYIWQQPFALKENFRAAFLMPAIAFAIASFYLIEQPARSLINGKFTKRPS